MKNEEIHFTVGEGIFHFLEGKFYLNLFLALSIIGVGWSSTAAPDPLLDTKQFVVTLQENRNPRDNEVSIINHKFSQFPIS